MTEKYCSLCKDWTVHDADGSCHERHYDRPHQPQPAPVPNEKPAADRWSTLETAGEVAGCYRCDTCAGFRTHGQPCAFCSGRLAALEAQVAAMREALNKAAEIASPYHRSPDDNGCPRLCSVCSDRRQIRDEIRKLVDLDAGRALLARLEAAEAVCQALKHYDNSGSELQALLDTWDKAKEG